VNLSESKAGSPRCGEVPSGTGQFDELSRKPGSPIRSATSGGFQRRLASGSCGGGAGRRSPPGCPRAIHEAVHLIDAGIDEMRGLLAERRPTADELARRCQYRAPTPSRRPAGARRARAAAARSVRPAAAGARMMRAIGSADRPVRQLGGSHEESKLRGLREQGVYEGRAAHLPSLQFDRIARGDVLVTESTTEAFNILLPSLRDRDGQRRVALPRPSWPGNTEFRRSGTRERTDRITDGTRVRVDGTR